jgi:hypothetical protein
MPFDVVNRRNPGTLCQSEVVYEDGIAHVHAIKGVAAQGRHFNPRRGRINGKCRVQHGGSPKVGSFVYRNGAGNLEGACPRCLQPSSRALAEYSLRRLPELLNYLTNKTEYLIKTKKMAEKHTHPLLVSHHGRGGVCLHAFCGGVHFRVSEASGKDVRRFLLIRVWACNSMRG